MSGDWYDVIPAAYARNLGRMLKGQRIHVEADECLSGADFVVDRVLNVTVGIDTAKLFVLIGVVDEEGREWTLHDDDAVEDQDDVCVGKFKLGAVGRRALVASKAVPL